MQLHTIKRSETVHASVQSMHWDRGDPQPRVFCEGKGRRDHEARQGQVRTRPFQFAGDNPRNFLVMACGTTHYRGEPKDASSCASKSFVYLRATRRLRFPGRGRRGGSLFYRLLRTPTDGSGSSPIFALSETGGCLMVRVLNLLKSIRTPVQRRIS